MATQNQMIELYLQNPKLERGWRQIAEEASKEQDSARLLELIDELLDNELRDRD